MRRQIDEVIAYQQSRSLEKELQLKIEQVTIFCQAHMTACSIHTGTLSFLLKRVAHGTTDASTADACCCAWQLWKEESDMRPAVQANAHLDGLGDHSQLYNDNDQAEREQRKLSREQASFSLR